jgi:type II secretory pathway pseudopilin PulG
VADKPPDNRSAGFLLMEVAVALAIVGMAFGYGYRTLSSALERLGRDSNTSNAVLFAQSTLERVGYDIPLGQAELSGNTRDGFTWLIESAPYGPATIGNVLTGYSVRVTVGWKEGGNSRQVQLSTVRLAVRGRR